jgi:hypothetical protein
MNIERILETSRRIRAAAWLLAGLFATLFAGAAAPASGQSRGTTGTPIGDWVDVRGTNYVVASALSRNNVQMWLDPGPLGGNFDARIVEQEISLLASYGLNSIRLFGSFYAHVADSTAYLANLKTVLGLCEKYGMRVTFVVWDVFGLDGLEVPILTGNLFGGNLGTRIIQLVNQAMTTMQQNQPTLPNGWGGVWFASPGNAFLVQYQDPNLWPQTIRDRANAYLDDVAQLFQQSHSNAFLSYDLVNEPDNLQWLSHMNLATMVHLIVQLSHYSAARIVNTHPTARFTVGTADAYAGILMHRELIQKWKRGFDYLSYHDYRTGYSFDLRASHAAALGQLDLLEVVCSEYFTAARQGNLAHLLGSLDAAGIGGQMWGAIEDRIFVVRYDQAFSRVYPLNPTRWWVNDTGVFEAVADANSPTGWRYDVKNPVFARVLAIWSTQETPINIRWPELEITNPVPQQDPRIFKITVRGPVGLPVKLLIGDANTLLTEFPGLGLQVLDSTTMTQVPIGWTLPTTVPGLGETSLIVRIPPTPLARSIAVQALLGDDYDLKNWQASYQTLATQVLLIN